MKTHLLSGLAVIGFLTLGRCLAEEPAIAQVERLPNIVELRIIDKEHVFLKTEMPQLYHLLPDGGWYDDLNAIDGATGKTIPNPQARQPNELIIKLGESSQDSMHNQWNTLKLIQVDKDHVIFHHTGVRRDGKGIERTISVPVYNDKK